ncbi:MAG TPA: tannase/feruloyl esterase family alpha/beta hydrolase [Vicinamibacterales bacterium]|nr:tannase/feruloyl esterase family alpha/beta hydrolase [Vicinamibacterales bacterium]
MQTWTVRGRLVALVILVSGLGGTTAQAQLPTRFDTWKASSPGHAPAAACRDLRAVSGFEFSIDAAVAVGDRPGVAEFCEIQGLIQPEVRFELSLPRSWNGRLYMFGNGGYAGENLRSQGRLNLRDAALAKGFAVVQTNTGHSAAREPLASFALHPQKLSDYAYRAVHVTALAAKSLAQTYYGRRPDRSYFDGCSTGGRQGLISAQRFPDDFDGIVVGAPVLDFSGTMIHYLQVNQAMRAASGLAKKMNAVESAIYGKCDGADGVKDGLIDDPRACRFDPAADLAACTAGSNGDSCFTAEEVKALQAVYGDVAIGGVKRFPGFPPGAEASVPTPKGPQSGWDPWIVAASGQPPISTRFLETFFKYMVTPGTEIDWTTVDLAKSVEMTRSISTLLDATDPDLNRFKARGGKILMYYGWADPALNAMMGVEYYERVRQTMGAGATDFFRLFMMPGVFHCAGGVGPDRFDAITTLAQWVEQGVAPDRIVASKVVDGKTTRTRPLCPYPQVAKHSGSGSIDDAANFVCTAPAPPGSSSATRGQTRREE